MEENDNHDQKVSIENEDCRCVEMLVRAGWEAEEPKERTPMVTPVKQVFYTETDTLPCYDTVECCRIIKGIQKFQMDFRGLPDIQYNESCSFLIGGDGKVYEGRGWHTAGPAYSKNSKVPPEMTGKCIEVAFIGAFKDEEPTEIMRNTANNLILWGIEQKVLELDLDHVMKDEHDENCNCDANKELNETN